MIANRISLPNLSDMFVAGLLHDIGYLIIGQNFKEALIEVVSQSRKREQSMSVLETEIIGASHGEIGGWLIEHWKLPLIFQVAAKYHDTPASAPTRVDRRTAAIMALAEALYPMQAIVLGQERHETVLSAEVLDILYLEEEDCIDIQRELEAAMENVGEILSY